jgi:hypothetical protein
MALTKSEKNKQLRNENAQLRGLIDDLLTTRDNLAFFSGPDQCHEVSEDRFVALQETIDDLEDIYIARVNAVKRK